MKLPVFKAVAMTFAFVAANAVDLIKIVWLPIVAVIAVMAGLLPAYMRSMMDASTASPSDPQSAMAAFAAMAPMFLLMFIMSIAFYLVVFTGILKLVIHGEKPRLPFYIGFGADELRLLGTWMLMLVIFIGAYLGMAIVIGASSFAAMSSPMVGGILVLVMTVVSLVAFCWLMLRMSLATPATIGQRTIGLGPSWNVAKGNVWRLFGYWLIWILLLMIIEVVMVIVLMPGYFAAMGDMSAAMGSGSVEQVEAASRQMNEAALSMYDGSAAGIAGLVVAGAVGTLLIVFFAVSGGVAWRLMTETSPEKHFE